MDNERALSVLPKPWDAQASVGEHPGQRGRRAARRAGASGKANVGMSNDNAGAKPAHRKTKVS